ncbi:MAG: DUF3558 family protein [Ilumatobacteraceae bacterium]
MHPPRSSRLCSLAAPVAAGVLFLAVTACGSDADSDAASTETPGSQPQASDAPTTVVPTTAEPTTVETVPSPECNGLSAADVGAAAGGEFDTAEDVSAGSDVSCLFSSSTTGDSVVVLTESTGTYLGGALDGLPIDQALGVLQTTYTTVMDAPTVQATTIGGFPGIVVTGTNTIIGAPVGYASTIVNGTVVEVSSDGAGLSATPEGFAPIVTAAAELAVAAQG